ncbi:proline and serine-rich protein 2 [Solea solea]|uniref:proline and serine-rich protein 2 n=1 Tax=Solea solea TaxID=90069 RepID=UPI00272D7407|nr:proline and serine-rich protein 2 [Solea solea]
MDARLQANPQLQVNGGAARNSRLSKDEALQFLSQEEQECIQFFEDTIDSLEETIHEDDRSTRHVMSAANFTANRRPVDNSDVPLTSSPHHKIPTSSVLARPLSPKDQDIIDLVRPGPDLVQTKEPIFNPTSPDFQSMAVVPESHIDARPRRDSLPSEYNPPLPSGSYGPSDSHHSYHPPGCIPTPVLIAQKIAETQSNTLPSPLHRNSMESEKPLHYSTDHTMKHGPPTSAKPTRFPPNISIILGNKEHQSQSLANVSIEERRAQMLANLTGTSHPLLQEDPQQTAERARNVPTRSVSFRDPTPNKSRMEALSKLGLNRNRAMSGGTTLPSITTFPDPPEGPETSAKPPEVSVSPTTENTTKLPEAKVPSPQIQRHYDRKTEIQPSPTNYRRSWEERHPQPSPSPPAVTQRSFSPPPLENKAPVLPQPEVTSLEFNSYGGKSIIVHPSVSSKSEPVPSPMSPEPRYLPPALANPSEFNSFGGKTKVMHTGPVVMTRNNLPDILSSHINKSQTLPAKPEPTPIELNSYGGKSRTFNPSAGLSRSSESQTRSVKPPAPTPAPRPPRHSYHGGTQKPSQREVLPPDHKRRSGSMFRPQGITVQFGGSGTSDESRKEALKKLGLLKESG